MTALYIVAAVAALLCAILFARIKLVFELDGDMSLRVSYLFLNIRLVPSPTGKIKLGDYTYEKTHKQKKNKKSAKKTSKKSGTSKKQIAKGEPQTDSTSSGGAVKLLYELRDVIISTVKRVPGKLRLNIYRLYIDVGGSDAAVTAVTYGVVVQAVGAVLALAESYADVRVAKNAVMILPNYISGKLAASVKVKLSVRVASVLGLGLRFIFGFIKVKMSQADTQ